MKKNILVMLILPLLHAAKLADLREDNFHDPRIDEQQEADRGLGACQDLEKLIRDALLRNNLESRSHLLRRRQHRRLDGEAKLGGKTEGPHDPKRVIIKRLLRIQRSAQDPLLHRLLPGERIDDTPKIVGVQRYCDGVHCEVSARKVILQRADRDLGLSRVLAVTLLARADKLDFGVFELQHRGSELLEDHQIALVPGAGDLPPEIDPVAEDHDVDILDPSPKQKITHVAADDIGPERLPIGDLPDLLQQGLL